MEDLERLRLLRDGYTGRRRGKNCRFHEYLARHTGRTLEGVAFGTQILNGHRPRSAQLGFSKRQRPAAVLPEHLTATDKAYLAAMFEAEGTLVRVEAKHWRFMFICNTDRDLIEHVASLVPFANIFERPADEKKNWQPCWTVATAARRGVLWAIRTLRPFCHGRKRARMNEAETELEQA